MAGCVAPDGYPYTDARFEPVCLAAPHISEAGSTPRRGTHAVSEEDTKVADEPTAEKTSSPANTHGPSASQKKPSARNPAVSSTTANNNSTSPFEVENTSGPTSASGEKGDEELGADKGSAVSVV